MMSNFSIRAIQQMMDALVHMYVQFGTFACISGFNNKTGEDRTGELARDLESYGFFVVSGSGNYKGTKEPSLLVTRLDAPLSSADHAVLVSRAFAYGQESYFSAHRDGSTDRFTPRRYDLVYTGIDAPTHLPQEAESIGSALMVGPSALALDFYSDFCGTAFAAV